MAKRKVSFEDPEEEEGAAPAPKRMGGGPGSRFSGKPSLDSDEEEEEQWGGELGMADIPGQEAAPQWGGDEAAVGQCPITPFNLEEEMESGSFDRAGNYRPRGTPLRPDPWLEALPWMGRPGEEGGGSAEGTEAVPEVAAAMAAMRGGATEVTKVPMVVPVRRR